MVIGGVKGCVTPVSTVPVGRQGTQWLVPELVNCCPQS